MKFSRRYSLVLGLAAALAQGCGGDSTGTGPGGNNNGGSGSGGSGTAAGLSSCNPTKCTGDPQYNIYSQAACDAAEKAACGAEFKAKNECSLANDKCNSTNGQDHSAVKAACAKEFDAWEKCNAAAL
jgi:hypothetical protein